MKQPLLLSMIALALLGGAGVSPSMAAQQSAPIPVLARDMKELGAWAQWTRREGYCTVQIIRDRQFAPPNQNVLANAARPAVTQVWLLRADGTAIPVLRTTTELPKNLREHTATYTYAFPESASKEAAAVAVMLDGRYFIERLERFPDEK
jgi:hypothetical protein